jgi:glycine cleavage system aminomethyltransferase T
MLAAGAVMRDVSGWEGAEWFEATAADAARAEAARDAGATFGRPACFDRWAAEHAAVRERVGLIDMSFMSKFHVSGPDAAALLNALSTADVASAPGRITYTQWLNANGKLEADVTVVRCVKRTPPLLLPQLLLLLLLHNS